MNWQDEQKKVATGVTGNREWVGLTVGETAIIVKMLERGNFMVAIAAIEAKLREKNAQ